MDKLSFTVNNAKSPEHLSKHERYKNRIKMFVRENADKPIFSANIYSSEIDLPVVKFASLFIFSFHIAFSFL